jgi:hypothetical protein
MWKWDQVHLPARPVGKFVGKPVRTVESGWELGVRPAIGGTLPRYVSRRADAELDRALARGGLVVVEGESGAGLTRTAFEAARRFTAKPWRPSLVAPADAAGLRAAAQSGELRRKLVWLDRIERFLTEDGLDANLLKSLHSKEKAILLGTVRSQERTFHAGHEVLGQAVTVRLAKHLSPEERPRRRGTPLVTFALGGEAGLAETLAAAPETVRKWRGGENPLGAALVSAAVDFRRARYSAPVPFAWLKTVAPGYLDTAEQYDESEAGYRAALSWATRRVHGASACLDEFPDGTFRAPDYLVEHAGSGHVPSDLWHLLADELPTNDPHYLTCMSLAGGAGHPMIAWQLRQVLGTDGARLLELARSCVDSRMCVACEFAGHDIDLAPLLTEVGTTLSDGRDDQASFRDALVTADQLGLVGMVAQPASPAGIAAGALAPELVFATAQALLAADHVESAKEWFAVARATTS